MFRMLLLALFMYANVSYAAEADDRIVSDFSHTRTSLEEKIRALEATSPTKKFVLILGANPYESLWDMRDIYSDTSIYMLSNNLYNLPNAAKEKPTRDESRWLEVDFNNAAQMERLSTELKKKFKVICFDLSVLKFFKFETIHYLHELLSDDGILYVPEPELTYSTFARSDLLPALADEDDMTGSPGMQKRIARSKEVYHEKTLREAIENFKRNKFKVSIVLEEEIRDEWVKDFFTKSMYVTNPRTKKRVLGKEKPIKVLMAEK